jgi:hypothetical protein
MKSPSTNLNENDSILASREFIHRLLTRIIHERAPRSGDESKDPEKVSGSSPLRPGRTDLVVNKARWCRRYNGEYRQAAATMFTAEYAGQAACLHE